MAISHQVKNVLVVLPGPMGDVILSVPALRRLRAGLPNAKIILMGNETAQQILWGNSWSDQWLTYDKNKDSVASKAKKLRSFNFDGAVLLSNSFRSAMLVYRAGITKRIGYNRDGRGILLTTPIPVIRMARSYAPISMSDYYSRLIDKAIEHLGGKIDYPDDRGGNHLELFVSDDDRLEVDKIIERWELVGRRMVIMVPGGAFGGSKWWPSQRFGQLADKLTDDGYAVIICCAPNDTERAIAQQVKEAAGKTIFNIVEEGLSLGGLKELIHRCDLMVANDTGPCHIAAAFDVPLVTIFGPTDPRWTATGYEKEIRLRKDVDCGPCQEGHCQEDHRCMNAIDVEDVYAAAKRQLSPESSAKQRRNNKLPTGSYYKVFDESFTPLPDDSGLVHKAYKQLLEKNNLADLKSVFAFEDGQQLIKPGLGTRQRLRVKLQHDNNEIVVYIKRFSRPSAGELLRRWITRRCRAGAGVYDFARAVELAQKHVAVARPIAFGQQSNWLGEIRSFAIIEELPNADALERLLPCWQDKQKEYTLLRDRKNLIRQIAQLVRQLHQGGYYHRDLYLSHIFLCRDADQHEQLCLIDLQRAFKPLVLARRWRIKDLAQFYYSARSFFSDADMMTFMHEYFQVKSLNNQQKRLIHAVYRKANRIARHDRKIKKDPKAL